MTFGEKCSFLFALFLLVSKDNGDFFSGSNKDNHLYAFFQNTILERLLDDSANIFSPLFLL